MPVNQGLLIKKITRYLSERGRDNILKKDNDDYYNLAGLCNGLAVSLAERVFYDAVNQSKQPSHDGTALTKQINAAIDAFYAELQVVIDTPDNELNAKVCPPDILSSLIDAEKKFNKLLDGNKIQLTKKQQKSFSEQYLANYVEGIATDSAVAPQVYFVVLVDTAVTDSQLTPEEGELLKQYHCPDIPLFEKIINRLFILHNPESLDKGLTQDDITSSMAYLHAADVEDLPLPKLEYAEAWIVEPNLDTFGSLYEWIPENRLVWAGLPQHAVFIMRFVDSYYFYDSNQPEKEFIYCDSYAVLFLKLALSNLYLVGEEGDDDIDVVLERYNAFFNKLIDNEKYSGEQMRQWLEKNKCKDFQVSMIKSFINKIENSTDPDESMTILHSALSFLPTKLGFKLKCYAHPDDKPVKLPEKQLTIEDFQSVDCVGESLLHKYALMHSEGGLQKFLEQLAASSLSDDARKSTLDRKTPLGFAAIHFAAQARDYEAVSALLMAGADVNAATSRGITPLSYAALNDDLKTVELLLKHGANPNQKAQDSNTPLLISCSDIKSIEVLKLFIKYGANLDDRYEGMPAIMLAMIANNATALQLLLDANANPNSVPMPHQGCIFSRQTPLTYAINFDKLRFAQQLLAAGADPSYMPAGQSSPLEEALSRKNFHAAQLLVSHGAVFNAKKMKQLCNNNQVNDFIPLFECPEITKTDSHAKQVGYILQGYANKNLSNLFGGRRHFQFIADPIAKECLLDKNKDLSDTNIEKIIQKHCSKLNGAVITPGAFKNSLDFIHQHIYTQSEDIQQKQNLPAIDPHSTRRRRA